MLAGKHAVYEHKENTVSRGMRVRCRGRASVVRAGSIGETFWSRGMTIRARAGQA